MTGKGIGYCWSKQKQCYRGYITTNGKTRERFFSVVRYGSLELALKACIEWRREQEENSKKNNENRCAISVK